MIYVCSSALQLENVRPFQIKRHGYQISEYALTHLLRDSEIHTFKRGDVIMRAGEHTDCMILVLDGTLVTETGRDKFKALVRALHSEVACILCMRIHRSCVP